MRFVWLLLLLETLSISVVLSQGFSIPTKRGPALLGSSTTSSSSITTSSNSRHFLLSSRGGGSTSTLYAADPAESKCPVSGPLATFGALWGSLGVVYILAKAIKRVLPIALEPLLPGSTLVLTPLQWSLYALNCAMFAYAEGYKGFQCKFSPLVVKRSLSLVIGTPQGSFWNYLLAPLYSMGLLHATRKRLITSWSVTMGVAGLVACVKRLPPVARCIMDAGVVVGLTWGTVSILYYFFKSFMTGQPPSMDACLPTTTKTTTTSTTTSSSSS